jgi:hypothetical protein
MKRGENSAVEPLFPLAGHEGLGRRSLQIRSQPATGIGQTFQFIENDGSYLIYGIFMNLVIGKPNANADIIVMVLNNPDIIFYSHRTPPSLCRLVPCESAKARSKSPRQEKRLQKEAFPRWQQ